jgi:hypothetical protein
MLPPLRQRLRWLCSSVLSCYGTTSDKDEDEDDDHGPGPLERDKYKDAAAALALVHIERMIPADGPPLICKIHVQGLGSGYGAFCTNQGAEVNYWRLKEQRKAPAAATGVGLENNLGLENNTILLEDDFRRLAPAGKNHLQALQGCSTRAPHRGDAHLLIHVLAQAEAVLHSHLFKPLKMTPVIFTVRAQPSIEQPLYLTPTH